MSWCIGGPYGRPSEWAAIRAGPIGLFGFVAGGRCGDRARKPYGDNGYYPFIRVFNAMTVLGVRSIGGDLIGDGDCRRSLSVPTKPDVPAPNSGCGCVGIWLVEPTRHC